MRSLASRSWSSSSGAWSTRFKFFFNPFSTLKTQGYLVSVDGYMNLQLANSEEYIDGALAGHLGEILIRCNNVLYIRGTLI